MIDPDNENQKILMVAGGLLIGHLFLYGRKLKNKVTIGINELVGDLLQFAAMLVAAMGFHSALVAIGWGPTDVWQSVTITILFCMSFDTYVSKLRDVLDARVSGVINAMFGNKPDKNP